MKKLLITLISAIFALGGILQAGNYTAEQQDAYYYAYSQKITTVSSIEKANLNGQLTRIAMAKMISNFAINVLGLQPDTSKDCSFSDVSRSLDSDYNYGVTQACQLGLMGIGNDGKKSDKFDPYTTVTRAQFATAFSRALSQANGKVIENGNPYYSTHLAYLQSKGIIKNTSTPSPSNIEKRGNVMIMMQRASNSEKNENNKKNSENKTVNYDSILGVKLLDTGISNEMEIKVTNKAKSEIEIAGIHLSSVTLDNSIGVYQGDNTMQPEYLNRNTDKTIDVKFWYPAELNQGDSTTMRITAEIEGGYAILDGIIFSINGNEYEFSKDTSEKTEWNRLFIKNNGNNNGTNKNGTKKTYYNNGQLHEILNYKDGKLNGQYIEYFEDGSLKSEGTYKNGELNGYAVRYCEKGKEDQGYYRDGKCISWEGNYENGEYIVGGTSVSYYDNGQIQTIENRNRNAELDGDFIMYYENGQVKEKGQYKNNKKTGEWIAYFEDGTMKSKGSYKNGEKDGHWVGYCEKGDDKCLEWEGDYKDGREVYGVEQYGNFNTYSFFWPTKQVESAEFQDDDGKRNGDYISFYENGQIKERGQYKNDKKTGDWIEYFENGEIKREGTYKNGEKIN